MDQQILRDNGRSVIENIKLPLYEIINVDDGPIQAPSIQQQNMVNDLAIQCASFLNWVANPQSPVILSEMLWKNQMRIKASNMYPQLDNEQIKKLVERDWRVMSEQLRERQLQRYAKPLEENQIQSKISDMKIRLETIRESLNE